MSVLVLRLLRIFFLGLGGVTVWIGVVSGKSIGGLVDGFGFGLNKDGSLGLNESST